MDGRRRCFPTWVNPEQFERQSHRHALDCQWLDITGVPAGDYQISVTVNPNRAFEEVTLDNNTSTVPVTIPAP